MREQPTPLPPFASVLKSREVEDPVNIFVHRPLAYAFVAAIYRTSITPNAVTFLAMLTGIVAGAMWLVGTPGAMIAGGLLLWAAAILDGADGILARAKKMQSQFGRALDGTADMVVAIATVLPGFYHLWLKEHDVAQLAVMVPAIALTVVHLNLYDYYKESYLRMTRPGRGGEGDDPAAVEKRIREAKDLGAVTRFAANQMLGYVQNAQRLVRLTNPQALREGRSVVVDERTAAIYRKHNAAPMQLWALVSLAPHSYLLAICGMFDRLDVYLWVRLFVMNAFFLVLLVWQRRATEKTMRELEEAGAADSSLRTA